MLEEGNHKTKYICFNYLAHKPQDAMSYNNNDVIHILGNDLL